MTFPDRSKIWDATAVEDTDTVVSPPVPVAENGFRSCSFQLRVNATGTGDLEGAFTVEVSNDLRVQRDIDRGLDQDLTNGTALWTDITSLLSDSATALAIADGDAGNSFVNITYLSARYVRLKFTGSGGTDGSIEAWIARVPG